MSCRCIKLASRSAIESLSSANCGSSASSGALPTSPLGCEVRREDREEGRSGVVGRETGERERVRDGNRGREVARGSDISRSCVDSPESIVTGAGLEKRCQRRCVVSVDASNGKRGRVCKQMTSAPRSPRRRRLTTPYHLVLTSHSPFGESVLWPVGSRPNLEPGSKMAASATTSIGSSIPIHHTPVYGPQCIRTASSLRCRPKSPRGCRFPLVPEHLLAVHPAL